MSKCGRQHLSMERSWYWSNYQEPTCINTPKKRESQMGNEDQRFGIDEFDGFIISDRRQYRS